MSTNLEKLNKEIEALKKRILDGYRYLEEDTSLKDHVKKSIEKRLDKEGQHLIYLEDKRKEYIKQQNELLETAIHSVKYVW